MVDEAWQRWQRRNLIPELSHGATEHDEGSEPRDLCGRTTDAQPPTEIAPIGGSVLYGRGGQNPSTDGAFGNGHTGHPPRGLFAIANDVSLVENDTLKGLGGGGQSDLVETGLGIRSEPDGCSCSSVRCSCSGRSRPDRRLQKGRHGEAASLQFIGPTGHKSGRTDDECSECERGILQKANGLTGLAEPHVVGQNAAAAYGSCRFFTGHHPTNTGLLMRQILEVGAWLY